MIIRSTLAAIAFGTIVLACAAEAEEQGKTTQNVSPTEAKPSGGGESTGGLASCCDGRGKCVPSEVVSGSQKDSLATCEDKKMLCAPIEFVKDQSYKGYACKSNVTIGSTKIPYDGVCLSDCLTFQGKKEYLGRDGCKATEICAPCINPVDQTPTGAPGCPGQ